MADGVYVTMARKIEHALAVAIRDPGPREIEILAAAIQKFSDTARTRVDLLKGESYERARARLPYKDD